MEKTDRQPQVVLLFDTYHSDSKRLHQSFALNHQDYPAVVIEENGYLPAGVQSVYGYFLGDYAQAATCKGRPLYFNEIAIPDYWEITSTNVSGKIMDLFRERARIFYAKPTNKRHVQTIDWLDEYGTVRYSDHYNRYGAIYARTTFNEKGQIVMKSYFDPEGREIITENMVTRDIVLNQGEQVRIFNNKTEFVTYFFKVTGYDRCRIYFNSLSTPFFVSCSLSGQKGQDVLFWQEPVKDEIPGNMQMILKESRIRAGRVFVQKRKSYERLMELGADPQIVRPKGYFYPFKRKNQNRPTALICTNSDQIAHCQELVQALPEITFHIAAITEMSSKLMSMEKFSNVHLYPGIKTDLVTKLFEDCDLYLDINYGGEILSAIQKAFLQNQVIFAFRETMHNEDFVARENVFPEAEPDKLIEALHSAAASSEVMEQMVVNQQLFAMAETVRSFLNME